ncbi:MAG: hypothetical protein QMD95_03780 [Candidatus Hodarchaeaceae archaeon]|nr:hypothetical protein [Candidatus Hodarchaeaceae archaeon]
MIREERGAAATLAIFVVFVILCSVAALHTFEAGYRRQLNTLQQRMATDTTKAVAAAVEAELNGALKDAIAAGMYESGRRGENRDKVEERLRTYFNQRIENGWSYSNFENIFVPVSDENSLLIEWLPDGSLRAYGYLDASFRHVMGTRAYGVKLDAGIVPRYGRMMHIAYRVYAEAQTVPDVAAFEAELNENYAAERLWFKLTPTDSRVRVTVYELYGGRVIAAENKELE